jgi:mono/diheme cytochrome c family protein
VTPENARRARTLYADMCAECHGPVGAGDGSSQKIEYDLRDVVAPLTDGAIYWKITHGVGRMPSHAGTLTDEERWLSVNHLRALSKAKDEQAKRDGQGSGKGYPKK